MNSDRWQGQPWWRPADVRIDRRQALAGLSAIVLASLHPRDGSAQTTALGAQGPKTCVLTPEAGEGPFYLDPKLLRSDITSGQPGVPLDLAFQVIRVGDCATLADARVDVWQADALGLYSGVENQSGVGGVSVATAAKQQFLRGTQMTDTSGNVRFKTIFPSWYGGRTPHVHFKVFLGGNEVVASQIFFPDDITKQIFSEFQPYREHNSKRTTFNNNDPFKEGIHSEVTRQRDAFSAKAVLVVKPR